MTNRVATLENEFDNAEFLINYVKRTDFTKFVNDFNSISITIGVDNVDNTDHIINDINAVKEEDNLVGNLNYL